MSLQKIRAVVLQAYQTGETSEVVHVFSAEKGRLSVMCKGLRNPKSGLRGALQPLSSVELNLYLKEGVEMGTLREAWLREDRRGVREDLERLALGSVLAEVAAYSCDVSQGAEAAFEILEAGLGALDRCGGETDQSAATCAAHYLVRLLTTAGYEPHIDPEYLEPWPKGKARPEVYWLDIPEGRVFGQEGGEQRFTWPAMLAEGAHEVPLPPECVRALYENQRTELGELGKLADLRREHALQFLDGLMRLAQWHLEHGFRSVRFWRGTFLKAGG